MDYILSILLSYLLLYKYITLFVVMFFSGLMIPFPINTLVFAAGVFASQGYFSLAATFLVAESGNVLGDFTGYYLTKAWKHRYVKKSYLEKIPYILPLEKYVAEYARLTIFASRFIGVIGSAVNFLSGLAGVPTWKFLTYDALGNAIVIGIFLLGGFFLGTFTESFGDAMSLVSLMIIVTFAIMVVPKFFKKKNAP